MRINSPQLEVDDLTAVVRESMAAARKQEGHIAIASPPPATESEDSPPALRLQPDFQPRADDRYHVNDLLQFHDRAFVHAAYRAVLKRSPDEAELLRDLKRLRGGYVNKIDLLTDLRFSTEGKAKNVELDGLTFPALIRRLGQLPLIGYPVRLGIAFLRLPNLVRDQREFAGYVLAQNQQIADFINLVSVRLTERLDQLAGRQQEIARQQADFERAAGAQLSELGQRISSSVADTTKQITDLRFRIGDLSDPQLDPLYVALEDRFRGDRDEIKKRLRDYLPYVTAGAPVVDLGCGRGEWLELLQETGIEARGVDNNRVQIDQCRARGLDVNEEDFLVYLQNLPDASAGVITGFHIVEHVSFNALIALLNETWRVLRPGGVVIFETPNPENVVVGSNYFYLDPTHRHPLPHELLEFLLKNRGFEEIETLNLHPWESGRVAGETKLHDRFNAYFYGPMDYAVVGRKVGP